MPDLLILMVPGAGLEPAWITPKDFKSYFTLPPALRPSALLIPCLPFYSLLILVLGGYPD